jgi:hypothetical protein
MSVAGGWRRSWGWAVRHPKLSAPLAAVAVLFVVAGAVGGNSSHKTGAEGVSSLTSGTVGSAAGTSSLSSATLSSSRAASVKMSQASVDRRQAGTRTAIALMATLRIKGRAPKTGYARDRFGPAWTDDNTQADGHNGCDTRNDILRRDLTAVVVKARTNGCTAGTGTLRDPYTGRTIHFVRGPSTSTAIQIDHLVALSDAWQTGAQQWGADRRVDLANDPLNLLAVDGPTNEAKGDGDAATWLPPNKAYRCGYVARQVAVKARYGLWLTPAEHNAIATVLAGCPGQKAPAESGAPATAPRTSTAAAPTTRVASSPSAHQSAPAPSITVYVNCDEMHRDFPHGVGQPGAHDHTTGEPVTNFTVNAALYKANNARDRDGDGIACEHR